MADPAVDALRQQLRERGYLTHGIERWFALDPWSSRAFWLELAVVALKAATLVGLFGALPAVVVMLFRNGGATAAEAGWLFASYAAAELVFAFCVVVALGLALKLRPSIALDTPVALLAISMLAAAVLLLPIAVWWSAFDAPPGPGELLAGAILGAVVFAVATVSVSAAMLSFSIYELQRIPMIHRRPRWSVIVIVAAAAAAIVAAAAFPRGPADVAEPMIAVRGTQLKLALVAVDGMTEEIFRSRPDLAAALPYNGPMTASESHSAAERWASAGTGVVADLHGVRSIEGIRLAGSRRVLQRVSRGDVMLRSVGPALHFARREPLPPTARRRDYVWEVVSRRGITAAAVNWWATTDTVAPGLFVIGPESIFSRSGGDPLMVDSTAVARTLGIADLRRPQLVTVYLPALDVVLNRKQLDRSQQLASSLRAIDGVRSAVAGFRSRGYEVVLAGLPGEGQSGHGVIASSLRMAGPAEVFDIAPTVADLLGFPLSQEMPGRSLTGMAQQPRIVSYGARTSSGPAPRVNREYYESLKSLGYIQ